ncbi:hypothetical protein CL630_00315 [bacterium]|nr:hypothetical protein [bacterium]
MNNCEKKATVLVNDHEVQLNGFYKTECYTYIDVRRQWMSLSSSRIGYLFGIRFINGKLELLFDERPRMDHDSQAKDVRECRPADEASSKVLQELFENRAYEGKGYLVDKVPLAWPW